MKKNVLFVFLALCVATATAQTVKRSISMDTAGGKVYLVRVTRVREEMADSSEIREYRASLKAQRDSLNVLLAQVDTVLSNYKKLGRAKRPDPAGNGNGQQRPAAREAAPAPPVETPKPKKRKKG